MAKNDEPDLRRRRFLIGTTSVVGAALVATAVVPFVTSMEPDAGALAAGAPVDVDFSKLEPGALMTVAWRSRPVWILRRTPAQLNILQKPEHIAQLKDPDSKQAQQFGPPVVNWHRSLRPDVLVAVGICTHLGCIPTYRPQVAPADLGPSWEGGFFCACHGSRYDLAARVLDGSPAPMNIPIPPYYFTGENRVSVGQLKNGSEQNWQPEIW